MMFIFTYKTNVISTFPKLRDLCVVLPLTCLFFVCTKKKGAKINKSKWQQNAVVPTKEPYLSNQTNDKF